MILITGSAGFIGFHLAQRLLAEGEEILGIDNLNDYYDPALKHERNAILSASPLYHFERLDIAETDGLNRVLDRYHPDLIVHLAAQAGVRYSLINPREYERSNVLGTLNIFEAARQRGIKRVVYASSSSVYGANTVIPFSESHATDHPVSLYAATKKTCEHMAYTYHHLYGIEMAGLRFFTVYGPYGRPDMALFKFAKNMLEHVPIDVYNHGKMKRDFTFVSDIVDGIIGAMRKEALRQEVYNLGCDSPVELEYLISVLEEALGVKAVKNYLPMQPGDVPVTYANITKARRELGFDPKVKIEEGVRLFADWFKGRSGV
jgi:UDP-glucuronate 4-epimerase